MRSLARATMLGAVLAGVLGALGAPASRADSFYAIRSLNTPIADFVTSGDAVQINVTADSTAAIQRAGLSLNGHDVTAALRPDAGAGSMTGLVSGLVPGLNTFQLFKKRGSQAVVGQLTIIRAMVPVTSCAAFAGAALPNTVI